MNGMLATAMPRVVRTATRAGSQMQDSALRGIRVTLQLAGRDDRDERGVAGRLYASIGAPTSGEASCTCQALIHLDRATGRPLLGDPSFPAPLSLAMEARLRSAIEHAWRTSIDVDLVDEQGRPLLLGALKAHPAGVSRWLMQYFQDGR
jgi:hypothetical protein